VILHRIIVALLFLCCALGLSARDGVDFSIPSARTAAVGGSHIALADDLGTLFTNPAGLTDVDPHFRYAQLSAGASGPIFTLAGVVSQAIGGADMAELIATPSVQQALTGLDARLWLSGPIAFGYAGGGSGFGVFNDSELRITNSSSSGLQVRVGERLVVRGGFAVDVPMPAVLQSRLAAGVGVKGFVRGDSVISTSLLGLPSLVGSIGPDLLSNSPFELISGIGIDLGVRYVWRDTMAAALTFDNLYSPYAVLAYPSLGGFLGSSAAPAPAEYSTLPHEWNAGFAYMPPLGPIERYVQRVTLLLDYRDILDFWFDSPNAENIVLKFGFGVEATILQVLSVRGGFNRGLLSAGLGLDLGFVRFNAAMYGTELSLEPGLRPVYNLLVGLEFRG
jgi:hypothetical protein